MTLFKNLLMLMRPNQWIKNCFVFSGVLFGSRWNDFDQLCEAIVVAFAFCLVSSCVYTLNDIVDRYKDREHPEKKNRPIASGAVSVFSARILVVVLLVLGITLSYLISPIASVIIFLYVLLNTLYSFRLKHFVIVDVFCISGGFMLRILAGTSGLGIDPSKWLMLCGLMITLFLGFAKRRAEIATLKESGEKHRAVLANYSKEFLDEILAVCVSGVIVTYSLYTMDADTIQVHESESLIYTVPFVIYALFRYLYLLHQKNKGGSPSRDLVQDKHIVATVIGWVMAVSYIVIF